MGNNFDTDPKVEPFFHVTDVLCGMIFCSRCSQEPLFYSDNPELADKHRYDQAIAMQQAGWEIIPNTLNVVCPECASR